MRDRGASPAACRCRPAGSTSRCCPSRCASTPAAAARACASRSRFGRRGRRVLRAARARAARPVRARPARRHRRRAPTSCSCCRGCARSRATAGGEDGEPAHARAALIAAAETEIDGLRPHREGSPASRIHWPAVARGAGLMERKLISEADSRPLVVLDPRAPAVARGARRRRARRRLADRALRQAAAAAGCCCPGDRRAHVDRARPARRGRRRTCGSRCVDEHTGPALIAAQNRRGLVVYVAARTVDRVAARARPHARRLPARGPRRAAEPPRGARGRRLPGLRRRAHRQRRR